MTKLKNNKIKRLTKEQLGIEFIGVDSTMPRTNGDYKFRSRIRKNGTQFYLGSFNTPEEAANAYNKRAKKLLGQKQAKKLGRWNNL